MLLAVDLFEISDLKEDGILEQRLEMIEHLADETAFELESIAYWSLQKVLGNVTSLTALDQHGLNQALQAECDVAFKEVYPKLTESYNIVLEDYNVIVIEDWLVIQDEKTLETVNPAISVPVYLKLIGSLSFCVRERVKSGLVAYKFAEFERDVQIPLPLLKNNLAIFKASSEGDNSGLARLVRYMLTTTVQMRILSGEALDGQSEPMDLLTVTDVENALNLAVILEQARIFRTYNIETVERLGLNDQLKNYLSSGEVDGADLFLVMENMQSAPIELGTIIAAAIQSYADEFIYSIIQIFWSDKVPDAVLQEPRLDWSELKARGEPYAKQKLEEWLRNLRRWLLLPPFIFSHFGTATIPTISQYAAGIDGVSKWPVPLVVAGNYELFSMSYGAKWFAFAGGLHTDSDNWPPAQVAIDPVDLILGESSDEEFRPEPYKISFLSNFGLPKTVKYYPVKQSYISMYSDPASETPYFDCLKYLIETIRDGVSVDLHDASGNTGSTPDGMIDMMAKDAKSLIEGEFPHLCWNDAAADQFEPG
ncbi:MAG: hypothetical protein JSV49_07605, partial [Thermoplasmata archaeon]